MCGIAGFQGGAGSDALSRLSRAIAHRGPDDAGQWLSPDGSVGLAHRRLSIIDLSPAGRQPMLDASGSVVIVYNGEIYNFRELRVTLESRGIAFQGHSDTEVLLALYREHGASMLELLNGIFAFAIWDRARGELFLACDRMGVKPLYFCDGPAGFFFASELKALASCGLGKAIDVGALYRYLGFVWSPAGATPFREVRRLGPGEALEVRGGSVIRRWHWAAPAWSNGPFETNERTVIRSTEEAFRAAVHRQMVSDVPVGAFLSGGLDSSAVVAMAREVAPQIECFTIDAGASQDPGFADDLPYARRVAHQLGVRLHEVPIDADRMAHDIEWMVYQLDEPLADPAALNVFYISRLAREHGVKVLLSGAGGDDLFAGYRRHRSVLLERYWRRLPKAVRRAMRAMASPFAGTGARGRRLAKAFAYADSDGDRRLTSYFMWVDPARAAGLFLPEHREQLDANVMVAPLDDYLRGLPGELDALQRMLALEQRFFLADHNLLYTDKMSMATGVEVRVPFLDNDLVAAANATSPDLHLRAGEGKYILKKAMEPYLPSDVIYRPKTGFGAPVRRWLRHELKDWVEDVLGSARFRTRGVFDAASVRRLIDDDRAGRTDAAYTILGLVCIELWCRRFLDTPGPA